jgi:hypothetical protein
MSDNIRPIADSSTSESTAKTSTRVIMTPEVEEVLDALFRDARMSAREFKPGVHRGRLIDEIDDDIEIVRKALDIEL